MVENIESPEINISTNNSNIYTFQCPFFSVLKKCTAKTRLFLFFLCKRAIIYDDIDMRARRKDGADRLESESISHAKTAERASPDE